MIVFLFGGQGSQSAGMGRDLIAGLPGFREELMEACHDVHPDGEELYRRAFEDGTGRYQADIRTTHPAIFIFQYALCTLLARQGVRPDALLGYSLGEYTALSVSGAIPRERALALVAGQSKVLSERLRKGAMLTILESPDRLGDLLGRHPGVEVAVRLGERHIAVSGTREDILALEARLASLKILCQRLPVEYPFHSRLMDPIRESSRALVEQGPFRPFSVPVHSCVRGKRLLPEDLHSEYFWDVVRRPVSLGPALRSLVSMPQARFVDVSPAGGIGALLVREYGLRGRAFSVCSPFGSNLERFHETARRFAAPSPHAVN